MCALGKDIINLEKMYKLLVLVYKELQRTKKHFAGPEYCLQLRPEKKAPLQNFAWIQKCKFTTYLYYILMSALLDNTIFLSSSLRKHKIIKDELE